MNWYVVYKSKSQRGQWAELLQQEGVRFFQAMFTQSVVVDNQTIVKQKEVFRNLIFVQTDQDIRSIVSRTDGLQSVFIDHATGNPAVVSNFEMERFMKVLELQTYNIQMMKHPIQYFHKYDRVRVLEGDFKGVEGYVVRVRGDRKLVISLDSLAVAISGIDHTLLQKIE